MIHPEKIRKEHVTHDNAEIYVALFSTGHTHLNRGVSWTNFSSFFYVRFQTME